MIQHALSQWAFAAWVVLVLVLYFAQFNEYWNRLVEIVRGAVPGVA
jgi:hypothetical protein